MPLEETPQQNLRCLPFFTFIASATERAAAVKLVDIARVIRSKNAGPTTLTLDLLFNDEAGFKLACASKALTAEAIAQLYSQPRTKVEVLPYPPALAIKIVMPRRIVSGDPGDSDVYGAQQHGPMLGVVL